MRKSQEIRNRIVVADIFHHLFQKLQVRRVLPVFHPVSDLIAENPAEIFVAREGEEAAGVGQHADEGGEHADAGKRRKLGFHAALSSGCQAQQSFQPCLQASGCRPGSESRAQFSAVRRPRPYRLRKRRASGQRRNRSCCQSRHRHRAHGTSASSCYGVL